MEKYFPRVLLLFILLGMITLIILAVLVVREWLGSKPSLNPKGAAYELNVDDLGQLWISDMAAGEIWQVNPVDGSYKVYSVSGSPVDARQSDGQLWWVDGRSNVLSQISVSDGTFTQWQVPDSYGFLGTSLDANDRFYATDASNPFLYRLDPSESSMCIFSLPGFGASTFIVRNGDYLWLADSFDSIIIRLDSIEEQLTWWVLPVESSPFGMAVDEAGNLWFTDQGTQSIAQLDPTSNQLNSYILPEGNYPQMLAIQSGVIWFTDQGLPGIGRLDPRAADHTVSSLTYATYQSYPNCNQVSPSNNGTVPITTGKINLQKISSNPVVNTAGWQLFKLAESSNPWGIGLTDAGFVVDPGHQMLMRFEPTQTPSGEVVTPGKIIPSDTSVETPRLIPTPLWSQSLNPLSLGAYLPIIIKNASGGLP
jgi:streptogramin lyase